MPEYKSLALSGATTDNMSRRDMLQWVNSTLSSKYSKIEELCSGVAYCQLMEMLFPNCIGIKKVKMNAKLEHEFTYNLKLFQCAFTKLEFEKSVPIDRLVKGRFQDNFEFLQWFKKFYDIHSGDKENSKSPNQLVAGKPMKKSISTSNLKTACSSSATGTAKKVTSTSAQSSRAMRAKSTSTSQLTPRSSQPSQLTPRSSQPSRPISPSSLEVLNETITQLRENIGTMEQERNYYFSKLHRIEILCTESQKNNEHTDWTKKVLDTLYKTDDGETGIARV